MNCANFLRACVHFIKFRYFFPNICCYLSAFFLETTPLPLRYHSITIQYFPRTLLPILRSTESPITLALWGALAMVRRVNLLLLCSTDSRLASLDSLISATCLLGDNPPSKKTQENAIFLAHLQILLYLCNRKPKVCRHTIKSVYYGVLIILSNGVSSALVLAS